MNDFTKRRSRYENFFLLFIMIRVFLADEQPVVIAGLRSFFSGTEFQIAGEATNGLDLIGGVERTCPNAVLLDTNQTSFQGFTEELVKLTRWEFKIVEFSTSLKAAPKSIFLETVRHLVAPRNVRRRLKYPNSLTRREIEVLGLIVQGYCNKDIAQALNISLDTVKEHVQNILRKTSFSDRTQAALWAVRQEIVSL